MLRSTARLRRTAIGLLMAGSLLTGAGAALAQSTFGALDRTSAAQVRFSSAAQNQPILAGSEVTVAGQGFRAGQQVSLLYGTTPLTGSALVADAEGKIAGKITVPADAVSGNHPIVVVAQGPYYATVADIKVSPTVPLSGERDYDKAEAQAARGLYQTAYSAKNNTIFVTSAVGRPPVRQSEIVKLHADNLKVLARVTPQPAPAPARRPGAGGPPGGPGGGPAGGPPADADTRPGVYAVYGVGVDDAKETVWVTNSRQNTVAVYRQSDLSLIKQFEPGAVNHARDAVIDSAKGKAYISATFEPEVAVFDTTTLDAPKRVRIASKVRGGTFSAASLSLDLAAHKLYVVSNATNEVAVVNTETDTVENVFPVPGARGSIGVSHDPKTGRIFVASQGSDNLVILDGATGAVVADTPVGAGALNVVFDPVKNRAYVSNRGAGTIAVTDVDGKIVANLGPAPLVNHVALGKGGVVYAVDKSAAARDAESDIILRLKPKR